MGSGVGVGGWSATPLPANPPAGPVVDPAGLWASACSSRGPQAAREAGQAPGRWEGGSHRPHWPKQWAPAWEEGLAEAGGPEAGGGGAGAAWGRELPALRQALKAPL